MPPTGAKRRGGRPVRFFYGGGRDANRGRGPSGKVPRKGPNQGGAVGQGGGGACLFCWFSSFFRPENPRGVLPPRGALAIPVPGPRRVEQATKSPRSFVFPVWELRESWPPGAGAHPRGGGRGRLQRFSSEPPGGRGLEGLSENRVCYVGAILRGGQTRMGETGGSRGGGGGTLWKPGLCGDPWAGHHGAASHGPRPKGWRGEKTGPPGVYFGGGAFAWGAHQFLCGGSV